MKASVIIPTYNSEKTISKCLESILDSDYSSFEVIVVDDGSTDNTINIVKKHAVRHFIKEHSGPAIQRNFGARRAKGEVLLFTDSDCIVSKDWIKNMVGRIKDNVVGVCGIYKNLNEDSLVSRYIQGEIEYRHSFLFREGNTDAIGTFSAGYRKDIFFKFGGFDESFPAASGEDFDLSYKLKEAGHKLVIEPRARVWHPHVRTLKEYFIQQFFRAYWRVLLYSKHPNKIKSDTYTGMTLPLFSFLIMSFWLSLLFLPIYVPFLFISAFYFGNLRFVLFLTKNEKKMFIIAPAIIFLRINVWLMGFAIGFVRI